MLNMNISIYNLYLLDIMEAARVLEILNNTTTPNIDEFLTKYFVIAYSRPFSGNKDSNNRKNYLSKKHINGELRKLHDLILDVRNELVAHTDYSSKNPRESAIKEKNVKFSFEMNDFDYRALLPEKSNLKELIKLNLIFLNQKIEELNSN
jgi:hypothetical protein